MVSAVRGLGFATLHFIEELGLLARFAGGIGAAMVRPPLRFGRFVDELYKLGVLSLIIICLCGVAVGAVLGLQGYTNLIRFGAADALGALVGLSLIRELGPVLTALLVTGRAGSAATAEIGTMVVTEQLDGLRMMSIDPVHYVVMPKVLAMVVVMPLLSTLFTLFGIFGGYLIGVRAMGLDPGLYMTSLEGAVDFSNDVVGSLLKALVFGILVGLIATYRGYTTEPTSSGVSWATTSTVVIASVTILLVDYVITALWGV
jgi:phospholipid/cholesterol/gamma-HCH transport system permease protein